jgi:glucokinase
VGVPGVFDATGSLVLLPNFPPAWRGVPLRQLMSQGLGLPTVLINDARSFTLAEARLGAAAGLATVVCVTLGTGVGGGIVIDGQLRAGPQGRAGEIGHQVIDPEGPPCGCGNRGCVESFVSAAAVCRAGGCDTVESVFRAAATGDPRAAAALAGMVEHLAVGIANLVTVLRPDGVVVGGGVAAAGEALLAPLRTAVAARSPLVDPSSYTVVAAVLGPTAGAVGAALWAQEQNDAVLV